MSKVLGILTGGGDVPGLNPAMKAVVMSALDYGYRIFGIRRGWGGLLNYDLNDPESHRNIFELGRDDVRKIDRTGGTFLHTSRTNPQKVKMNVIPEFLKNSPLGIKVDEDTMDYTPHVLQVLDHVGFWNRLLYWFFNFHYQSC
jgi:6-phosphofructokinase 1